MRLHKLHLNNVDESLTVEVNRLLGEGLSKRRVSELLRIKPSKLKQLLKADKAKHNETK